MVSLSDSPVPPSLGHTVWLPTIESHSVLPALWTAILTPPTLRNWYARSQLGLLHFGHTLGRSLLCSSWGTHSCPHRHLYAVTLKAPGLVAPESSTRTLLRLATQSIYTSG